MSKRNVEVRYHKKTGRWLVWMNGVAHYDERTKVYAVESGRSLAREYARELVVKNKDGKIGWRNSYGGDSPRRRG